MMYELSQEQKADLIEFFEQQKALVEVDYCDVKQMLEIAKQAKTMEDVVNICRLVKRKEINMKIVMLKIEKKFIGDKQWMHIK